MLKIGPLEMKRKRNKIKLLRRKRNGIIRFEVTETTEQANANPESPTDF